MSAAGGPRYSIIPGAAATDHRLRGRDLQVLCVLGTSTDGQGWCRRSQVKLAQQIGCGRATVWRSLLRLTEFGYVEQRDLTHEEITAEAATLAGTIKAYRVVIDRPENTASKTLPINEHPAHSERAGGARSERAPLTTKVNDQERASLSRSSDAFERWWAAYPRKVGKLAARTVFDQIMKRRMATVEELIAGALAYAKVRAGEEPRFTKHPSTWLNSGCWADERDQPGDVASAANVVWVHSEDPRWPRLAACWRAERGKSPPHDKRGGWTFPTEWLTDDRTGGGARVLLDAQPQRGAAAPDFSLVPQRQNKVDRVDRG